MTSAAVSDLAARIRARIASEGWMAGERLGTERGLAEQLGVSRSRLRGALDILREERLVRALIGRAGGIYIADGRLERNLDSSPSLPDIARVQGIELASRVLDAVVTSATPRDRRILHLKSGESVIRLRRIREANNAPLSLEENRLPETRFPDLLSHDLRQLGRVARESYGFIAGHVTETLEIVPASTKIAVLLKVSPAHPVARIRRISFDAVSDPTELAFEHFDAYRMRFHLHAFGFEGNVHRSRQS